MNLSKVLVEGRKENFLAKYRDKFSDDDIKKIFLMSRELASNNKFLEFLGKVVSPNSVDEDLNKAKIGIEKFIRYQKNLEKKDINQYKSLDDIFTAISKHENKVRRDVKKIKDADVVYEDDRFTVVSPLTHRASCYYGSGSKWCTAALSSDSHFDRYNRDGKLFYFLDKKAKSGSRFYKVALLQKYDGTQIYYDAPDKTFKQGWILGTPEFFEIDEKIQKYMNDNYSDDIELFKDKAKAEQELRKRELRDRMRRQRRLMQMMDTVREEDAWNLQSENIDELGLSANAVMSGLRNEWLVNEINEDEDIYFLLPNTEGFYPGDIRAFKWLGENENESEYIVGKYDVMYDYAKERLRETVDDIGLMESFNRDFLLSHLNVQKVADWFETYYDDYVRDEWEEHFEKDEIPTSDEQNSEIEKLSQKIESLYRRIEDGSENEDEIRDKIMELEEEIEDIKDDPQGEPTEEMYEEKVKQYVQYVKDEPLLYIQDYGLEDVVEDFIDVDSVLEEAIDMDGLGHNISYYDGVEYEVTINGEDYHVFRVE